MYNDVVNIIYFL
jgi:hypothetical protein